MYAIIADVTDSAGYSRDIIVQENTDWTNSYSCRNIAAIAKSQHNTRSNDVNDLPSTS